MQLQLLHRNRNFFLLNDTNIAKAIYKLQLIKYIIKLKPSFIINGLLQYYDNTSCHYQAKIFKEKKQILEIQINYSLIKAEWHIIN